MTKLPKTEVYRKIRKLQYRVNNLIDVYIVVLACSLQFFFFFLTCTHNFATKYQKVVGKNPLSSVPQDIILALFQFKASD